MRVDFVPKGGVVVCVVWFFVVAKRWLWVVACEEKWRKTAECSDASKAHNVYYV